METIRGKTSLNLDSNAFRHRLANYDHILLDLGTGDGRFVRALAGRCPDRFIVGLDACRENLREHSRTKLPNMLFVISSAQDLPSEFEGLFAHITINFPWGSLLDGLLAGDTGLTSGLASVSRPDARIEIYINGGALAEAGTSLAAGAGMIYRNLERHGWNLKPPHCMDREALRQFPTTWARRLACGRDPRAIHLSGRRA